jgi:hypothetical protein
MPMPVSRTLSRTCSASAAQDISTLPPESVNFTAFDSRFTRICRSFSGSARAVKSVAHSAVPSVSPFARACGATSDSAATSDDRTGTSSMS